MPPGIGYSFAPGSQDTQLPPRGQGGQGVAPQQAIRTLSLRVPQTQSVPGISPLPLLNASGGGGSDLDMLVAALMRAFGGGGMSQPGLRGGQPPRVRPILPRDAPPPPLGPAPPNQQPDPYDRQGWEDYLANPPARTGPPPRIPRDFPPYDGSPPLPAPSPSFDMSRVPGGGFMGGTLKGRDPGDVFGNPAITPLF